MSDETHAPPPFQPVRSAMRDEMGRRIVGATMGLVPGAILTIAGGVLALRLARSVGAWIARMRAPKSDATIAVTIRDVEATVGRAVERQRPKPEPRVLEAPRLAPLSRSEKRALLLAGRRALCRSSSPRASSR